MRGISCVNFDNSRLLSNPTFYTQLLLIDFKYVDPVKSPAVGWFVVVCVWWLLVVFLWLCLWGVFFFFFSSH